MITTLLLIMYLLGVIIQVLLEAQNSVKSSSNGLPPGLPGIVQYLELQGISLLARLFLSIVFFTVILDMTQKAVGATFTSMPAWAMAGLAGYGSSAFLRQVSGLIPGLRVEVAQQAPPPSEPPK